MEIVSSFGQLAAYRFVCNEDLGRRCAFLEVCNSCCTKTRAYDIINIKPANSSVINLMEQYIDHSITNKACAGLNGMKLGGSIITAVQVFPNPLEVQPFPCPIMY
jgi:splicing factor U2AF subunit